MGAYHHDYGAFRVEVLNAGFMKAEMVAKAEVIKARAEAIAPVDSGQFKSSFSVSSGTYGGLNHDRAYATVANTDPAAQYIEFGTSDTPRFRTLGKAAGL